jgi:methenyltetrahydromethanopterin cyclohydrolase
MTLNDRALRLVDELVQEASRYRVHVARIAGARVVDCGGLAEGGLAAGVLTARICLADLADVSLVPYPLRELGGMAVQVHTDDPVRACLASQYAGWRIQVGSYFAMASGPMRIVAAREELYQHIAVREEAAAAVGVLESSQHPTEEVVTAIVAKLPPQTQHLHLLTAPTTSLVGTLQVVARSVETALHKLYELRFDVQQVVSAWGIAPLPPVARDTIGAIGRTNDAILYGAEVVLWVHSDDEQLASLGPHVPACASRDYGQPFADIFTRYHGDFYRIDPLLFSPAVVEFRNLRTGRGHRFGQWEPNILRRSFGWQ